ncbi:MAG: CBS domain-containing protein [Polyangiaceae bacterium]
MAVTVDEVMNREVFSVKPNATLDDASVLLQKHHISGAPVLDAEGVPVGMISLRDLAPPGSTRVEARMSRPVMAVPSGATLESAALLLSDLDLHRAIVVDANGKLIGIVTSLDLLRGLLGVPAPHPHEQPPVDDVTGLVWSDDLQLTPSLPEKLPQGPGLLALVHGGKGRPERVVWAEAATGIRGRVAHLLDKSEHITPHLLPALEAGELRLRYAASEDTARRMTALRKLLLDARNKARQPS